MSALRRFLRGSGGARPSVSPKMIGAIVVVLGIVGFAAVYQKAHIATVLHGGETITAVFSQKYKLVPYASDVKLAGVVIGTVTGTEIGANGTSIVSMEVDNGVREKLGTAPAAHIRPTLVLGGKYYVDLVPGGRDGKFQAERIPVGKTTIPVELDKVLSTLTPDARTGLQASVRQLNGVLRMGGQSELRGLLEHAPETLAPAGDVLKAFQGDQPDDLTVAVQGFQNAAEALTKTQGQVGRIVESLEDTAAALASKRKALSEAVDGTAQTLHTTRTGLVDLQGTLARLTTTAKEFRPSARALEPLLAELDPVLARARLLVHDMRPLLRDLGPAAERLVPTTEQGTAALQDLEGPVMKRINGPILDTVVSPWHGTGRFEGSGDNHALYKELGYLISNLNNAFAYWTRNGAASRLSPGVGGNSLLGGAAFPKTLEQYLETLGSQQPQGPQQEKSKPGTDPLDPPLVGDPIVPPPQRGGHMMPYLPGLLGGAK